MSEYSDKERLIRIETLIEEGNKVRDRNHADVAGALSKLDSKITKAHERMDEVEAKHQALKDDFNAAKNKAIGAGVVAGLGGGGACAILKSIFSVLR